MIFITTIKKIINFMLIFLFREVEINLELCLKKILNQ
jgi:hypothetical protein